MLPSARAVGVLANPQNPIAKPQITELRTAAQSLGREMNVLNASSETEIERAFVTIDEQRIQALVITADPFFDDRRDQIIALAARYRIPASYTRREFVIAGGLMGYDPDALGAFRQAGVYTGRILKGEKPGDLPVMRPTKFQFVINMKTARALGLNVPDKLLAIADEVIE